MPSPLTSSPVSVVMKSADLHINALLSDTKWGGPVGTGVSLSFSFPWLNGSSAVFSGPNGIDYSLTNEHYAPQRFGLNTNQQTAAERALSAWANVANINFSKVSDNTSLVGDIRFAFTSAITEGAWGHSYYPNSYYSNAGDVWIDADIYGQFNWSVGSYNFESLIHEIGHSLGLKHPGNYDTSDGYGEPPFLSQILDNRTQTVMSYNDLNNVFVTVQKNSNGSVSWTSNLIHPETPMVLDIQAIQYLYGANKSFQAGDDIYTFDPKKPFLKSIWDAGGVDTIDISNFTTNCIVDLRPGYYSTIAVLSDNTDSYNWVTQPPKPTYDNTPNLGIAYNSIIENAIGGAGNDKIIGNNSDNQISGGAGNDSLYGNEGNDVFDWDADSRGGRDIFYGGLGDDEYVFDSNVDVVVEFLNEGIDTIWCAFSFSLRDIKNVENLFFFGHGNFVGIGNDLDNIMRGGAGSDQLDGGNGNDYAFFWGLKHEYTITSDGASLTVRDNVSNRDGVDTVSNFEFLSFRDQIVSTSFLVAAYNLVAVSSTVNEGATAIFTLSSTGVAAGTRIDYILSGVSSADVSGGALTGTVTIGSDGKATIAVPLIADNLTEGTETLTVTAAGKTASITINDTSLTPSAIYSVIANSPAVNEGGAATFTLSSAGAAVGTRVAYELSGVSAADIQGGLLAGTATIGSDGKAIISIPLISDNLTEGKELLTVTVGGKSASVVVNDVSIGALNKIFGTNSDQKWVVSGNSNDFDGGAGIDTIQYLSARSAVSISKSNLSLIVSKDGATDRLTNIERIDFTDGDLIFDVTSVRAPAAYRLYGGAFDRTPDEGGFRYWTSVLDQRVSLHDVAASFIVSGEFTARYGNNLSNSAFVDALYMNVLNRPGDAGGVAYWNDVLNKKWADRADVLVSFTQLPEYVGLSVKDIENGYWVV